MDNHQLDGLCQEWASWCFTRRFYTKLGSQSLLARLHPSKSGKEPDARNSAHMQHFNRAVHALAEDPQYADQLACFRLMYVEEADHIKRQADKLGISRPTYYNRSRAFARRAWALSLQLKRTQQDVLTDTDEHVTD
jgi:hypothetical protein